MLSGTGAIRAQEGSEFMAAKPGIFERNYILFFARFPQATDEAAQNEALQAKRLNEPIKNVFPIKILQCFSLKFSVTRPEFPFFRQVTDEVELLV